MEIPLGPAACSPVTVHLIDVTGILVNAKEQIPAVTMDGLDHFVKVNVRRSD